MSNKRCFKYQSGNIRAIEEVSYISFTERDTNEFRLICNFKDTNPSILESKQFILKNKTYQDKTLRKVIIKYVDTEFESNGLRRRRKTNCLTARYDEFCAIQREIFIEKAEAEDIGETLEININDFYPTGALKSTTNEFTENGVILKTETCVYNNT